MQISGKNKGEFMQENYRAMSWALGLWGVFSVIFGVAILAWPSITLKAFLIMLGIYLLAVGATMLIGSLINRTGHWVVSSLVGLVSAYAGLYVFSHPQASALAVLSLIAIWALVVGVLQIVAGFEGKNNWLQVFAGVVYAFFGMYIFANPKGGAIALVWLIGLSVVVSGIALVISAFEANSAAHKLAPAKK